jgi:hypothetical protein
MFVPPLLKEIPGPEGVISEEFIKDVLAKVWKEMEILNPCCPFDAYIEVPLTLIENFLYSVPICASPMNKLFMSV